MSKRLPRNYLQVKFSVPVDKLLRCLAARGLTLQEAALLSGANYSTLKTYAWRSNIEFKNGSSAIDRKHTVKYKGQRIGIKDLAETHGISRKTLSDRLRRGWPVEDALKKPVRNGNWVHSAGTDRVASFDSPQQKFLRMKL